MSVKCAVHAPFISGVGNQRKFCDRPNPHLLDLLVQLSSPIGPASRQAGQRGLPQVAARGTEPEVPTARRREQLRGGAGAHVYRGRGGSDDARGLPGSEHYFYEASQTARHR
jgi:hypothetical protein